MPITKQEVVKLKKEAAKAAQKVRRAGDEMVRILRKNRGLYFTAHELMEGLPKEWLKRGWDKKWDLFSELGVIAMLFGRKEVHSEFIGGRTYYTYFRGVNLRCENYKEEDPYLVGMDNLQRQIIEIEKRLEVLSDALDDLILRVIKLEESLQE